MLCLSSPGYLFYTGKAFANELFNRKLRIHILRFTSALFDITCPTSKKINK